MEKRYYYKCGNSLLNVKSPVDNPDYIEITEQEFNELSKPKEPTAEQKALQEKRKLHDEKEALLTKYKHDVEQVDLFGMQRDDYAEKKALCAQLVRELKELEQELRELEERLNGN